MLYSLFEYPFSVDFFTSNTERERESNRETNSHILTIIRELIRLEVYLAFIL